MRKDEIEETVELLQHYFDQASPEDAAGNIRLIKRLTGMQFSEMAVNLLLFAPTFIIDSLRSLVQVQTARAIFAGASEDQLDFELRSVGLALVMKYVHLIQASGSGGVMALITVLPKLARDGEDDIIAIIVLALSLMLPVGDTLSRVVFDSVVKSNYLRLIYDQTYNTAARIALAYLLFECNQRDPFQRESVQLLARGDERRRLEGLLKPGNLQLRAQVMGAILLDVASNGKATHPEAGWKRRR